jgi:predicted transposase YbfD/YdcC
MAAWGEMHAEWLTKHLGLKVGIPSHDTFGRVFGLLNAKAFEACLLKWMGEMVNHLSGQQVSLDGKEVRRSHDRYRGKQAIQVVSAWLVEAGLVLGARKTARKGQEIATVQELLTQLELQGCVVTADALHCQTETARTIVDGGGDYVLTVKTNQPTLHKAIRQVFTHEHARAFAGLAHTTVRQVDKGHGRLETRTTTVITDPAYLREIDPAGKWWQLGSIFRVERTRQLKGRTSHQVSYGISSLRVPAQQLAPYIRGHWHIENSLHWRLDVVFREDQSRIRQGAAPANLATVRRIALNLLQREKSHKAGLKGKRLKAAWDTDYLLKVLASA